MIIGHRRVRPVHRPDPLAKLTPFSTRKRNDVAPPLQRNPRETLNSQHAASTGCPTRRARTANPSSSPPASAFGHSRYGRRPCLLSGCRHRCRPRQLCSLTESHGASHRRLWPVWLIGAAGGVPPTAAAKPCSFNTLIIFRHRQRCHGPILSLACCRRLTDHRTAGGTADRPTLVPSFADQTAAA